MCDFARNPRLLLGQAAPRWWPKMKKKKGSPMCGPQARGRKILGDRENREIRRPFQAGPGVIGDCPNQAGREQFLISKNMRRKSAI